MFDTVVLFCRDVLPGLVALAAVIVSAATLSHARKTQLTSAYFAEKTKAYSDYLDSVAQFVFHPSSSTRDSMTSSFYRMQLFACEVVLSVSQEVYMAVLQWNRQGRGSAKEIDDLVNRLGRLMRDDLAGFDHR